jgi:cell division protein DivIC
MTKQNWKKRMAYWARRYRFYLYSFGVLFVWMSTLDTANFYRLFSLSQEVRKYEEQAIFYQKELERVQLEEQQVMGTTRSLELFAREKYLMKRDGEKVVILVDPEGKPLQNP